MHRIKLIPVNRFHATSMFHILSDKTLYQFTGGEPPQSVVTVEQWFTALESQLSPDGSERWLTWVVQLIETSKLIGYVQATVKRRETDIAWLIGQEWQGLGYASEAATELMAWISNHQITEVTARIHPDHMASQRIAAKLGMHPSGTTVDGEEIWRRTLST